MAGGSYAAVSVGNTITEAGQAGKRFTYAGLSQLVARHRNRRASGSPSPICLVRHGPQNITDVPVKLYLDDECDGSYTELKAFEKRGREAPRAVRQRNARQ
ncbi:hypothetical protein GCM10010442_60980 [Kitasatospora kifunensis]